jgi:hypothetical protein
MTRETAVRKLRAIFGATAYWRVGEQVTSPERRAEAAAERDRLKAEAAALTEEIERIRRESGMAELERKRIELRKAAERAGSYAHYRRFAVGRIEHGIAFCVEGEGDTWEEAIAAAQRKGASPT